MGIFNVGYQAARDRDREIARDCAQIERREVAGFQRHMTALSGVVEIGGTSVDGDFTKGIGQGVGITIGIMGAAWLAGKIIGS